MPLGDTIVARSTPYGYGGIAVVRLSGVDSLKILKKISRQIKTPVSRVAQKTKIYHKKNILDSKTRAINLVQEYESISKVDFVSRLQKLVHTYEALFQVYGEDIFTDVDKRSVNLQSFVPSELSKLIRVHTQ